MYLLVFCAWRVAVVVVDDPLRIAVSPVTVPLMVTLTVSVPAARAALVYTTTPTTCPGAGIGISVPSLTSVAAVGAGLIVPPMVAAQIMKYVPASLAGNPIVGWVVRAAAVVLPAWAVRKYISRSAGDLMLIAGGAGLAMDVVKAYMPGVIPGLGYQPMLGQYVQRRNLAGPSLARQVGLRVPLSIATTPERMSPVSRM